jgi:hypothetical protein
MEDVNRDRALEICDALLRDERQRLTITGRYPAEVADALVVVRALRQELKSRRDVGPFPYALRKPDGVVLGRRFDTASHAESQGLLLARMTRAPVDVVEVSMSIEGPHFELIATVPAPYSEEGET